MESTPPLTPAVYMRASQHEQDELMACRSHLPTFESRVEVPGGSLVFARYSALPFNRELCRDFELLGSRCVNDAAQHAYVADFQYYADFKDVTFPSWDRFDQIPRSLHGEAFVVKGRANSRKQQWSTHMFAKDFQSAVRIGAELMGDALIGPQGLAIRQYIPLETFETSISGLPYANEWRCFFLGGEPVAHGYYWGSIDDFSRAQSARADFLEHGLPLAQSVASACQGKIPFCAVDVAKAADGRWLLVEINDGNMSGLNGTIEPDELYLGIKRALLARPDLLAPLAPAAASAARRRP